MELLPFEIRILENILCDIIYGKTPSDKETWQLALDLNTYITKIPIDHNIIILDAKEHFKEGE